MSQAEIPPDGAIVAEVLDGQRDRFAQLVRRYHQPLLRVAISRLTKREWAEDAVQETFLCAFKSLHTYNSKFSFRTWLWTILLNQCRRLQQKRRRWPYVLSWADRPEGELAGSDLELPDCESRSPQALASAREQSAVLDRLLRSLPGPQADALRLRFFGGLKFQEIANSMGCSLSSAKNRVRLGLEKLSGLIGTDPSPARAQRAPHENIESPTEPNSTRKSCKS